MDAPLSAGNQGSERLIKIRGLDLHIDKSVQEICQVSNATSSHTRSVLYVLMIVCSLALSAILNTIPEPLNWGKSRIDWLRGKLAQAYDDEKEGQGSTKANLFLLQRKIDATQRNQVEVSQTVKLPILGNAFDVNNLGILAGLTLLVLLIILNFTFSREMNNLRLALKSISDRYPDEADAGVFDEYISAFLKNSEGLTALVILKKINATRRQYHYNYLSMNEIFTSPPLKIDAKGEDKLVRRLGYWFLFIPCVIQGLIIFNDAFTIKDGMQVNPLFTVAGMVLSVGFLLLILWSTVTCYLKKKKVYSLYEDFKSGDYVYDSSTMNNQ